MEHQVQLGLAAPSSTNMISHAGEVAVNNSSLTAAGGHVNSIAVNISMNDPPLPRPIPSAHLWLRTLGEWLLGPSMSPSPQPSPADTMVADPNISHTSPALSKASSSGPEDLTASVEIVPLEHIDIHGLLALAPSPARMPHQIYVRHLYPRGHGYPCSNPKPRGTPVKIGDIGLLTDRFQVLQNLYDLPEIFNPVPVVPLVHDPNVFAEGDTITGGTDGCRVKMSESQAIEEITFRCRQEEGAMLAITSPTELLELGEIETLRRFLFQHADKLFTHLTENFGIPDGSSIYIITGVILSSSWAIATHDCSMDPADNVLVLRRAVNSGANQPFYIWTARGNAQTRTHNGSQKDQVLFLRGFLMSASPAMWRARREALKLPKGFSGDIDLRGTTKVQNVGNSQMNTGGGQVGGHHHFQPPSHSIFMSSAPQSTGDISIQPMPYRPQPTHDYPSYLLNQILLDSAGSDYAITHDADWRDAVRDASTLRSLRLPGRSLRDRTYARAPPPEFAQLVAMLASKVDRVAFLTTKPTCPKARVPCPPTAGIQRHQDRLGEPSKREVSQKNEVDARRPFKPVTGARPSQQLDDFGALTPRSGGSSLTAVSSAAMSSSATTIASPIMTATDNDFYHYGMDVHERSTWVTSRDSKLVKRKYDDPPPHTFGRKRGVEGKSALGGSRGGDRPSSRTRGEI